MKNVMKRAWEIAKEGQKKFGGKVKEYFAIALKMAWAETKQPKKVSFEIRHQPSGGKEWVAEIVGRHPKFKFDRKFINATQRNWSSSGKTGRTVFTLEEGKVYEVNEPFVGRYFVTVENGVVVDVENIDQKIA
jgi:hypothetical protein